MLTLLTGALAGLVHVLTGPDHLTAVAPLALADRRRGWLAGWTWGIGHASGIVVVALIAIALRDLLPSVDVISRVSERAVGVVLIGVGAWAFRRSLHLSAVPHQHEARAHGHLHVGSGPGWVQRLGHAHASFYLGILHGVAGSSHFLGVLPALALPSRTLAVTYIGAFGVGTVFAMTGFAAAMGLAGQKFGAQAVPHRAMMRVAAGLALGVGAFWLLG